MPGAELVKGGVVKLGPGAVDHGQPPAGHQWPVLRREAAGGGGSEDDPREGLGERQLVEEALPQQLPTRALLRVTLTEVLRGRERVTV